MSSAEFQAALAEYVRDPSQPAPPGIAPERLAVYTRLLHNNIKSFLDLCFSDSQHFAAPDLWQHLQQRFLAEARPESPFFNDIPAQFLAYARSKNGTDRLPENVLAMMDFETLLLYAETAPVPAAPAVWHDEDWLCFSPAARLAHYDCDFVGSRLARIDDAPCSVLVWRNRDDEVFYRALADTDLFLLEHFSKQRDTFATVSAALRELAGAGADAWLREAVNGWVAAGVLLPLAE